MYTLLTLTCDAAPADHEVMQYAVEYCTQRRSPAVLRCYLVICSLHASGDSYLFVVWRNWQVQFSYRRYIDVFWPYP